MRALLVLGDDKVVGTTRNQGITLASNEDVMDILNKHITENTQNQPEASANNTNQED